ncbi:hypothetical protein NKI20_07130 [Mesorhizobium sp. M0830]|uniref:hypothetical protein n=1 Tax=Mesorhizobium sp. M0830 TaxID=2957008 RepID=UPI0033376EEA
MGKKQRWDNCALCGKFRLTTREHVVPKGLYPESKGATSTFQRITIAACFDCNNGTSDDDVHFRNVVAMSGDANPSVREVWEGPIRRSFEKVDGRRRALDLFKLMKPALELEGDRYMIYPGNDPRVIGTIRKVVRGLCHHHQLLAVVKNDKVWADVLKYAVPTEFAEAMVIAHAEPDILDYKYLVVDEGELHSFWLLRFYERTTFIAVVFNTSMGIEEPVSMLEGAC